MRSGDVVDDRFEIQQRAEAGGMGQVFRALDRLNGEVIALKVLHSSGPQELNRFAREAQALAALRLPGVVRYVAHGTTEFGRPYLAMQWLEGETLRERLTRTGLTVAESVALALRIGSTLGAIHRFGLVHRDLKPSNLLLLNNSVEQVMLIDFGIVRMSGLDHQLTRTGAVLGTPGYMAPEQARGQLQIDARVDVFALGCVLYRCLTGRPAFEGAGLGLLAKVLLEEPQRLRQLQPEIPARLDDLVARMLSKAPEGRPRDGTAVAAELALLGSLGERAASRAVDDPRESEGTSGGITSGERRFMCLVLARGQADDDGGDDATRSEATERERDEDLAGLAARLKCELEVIDRSWPMLVLTGADVATDLVERASRAALALQLHVGGAPVVLVTGRALRAGKVPVADLIDRAMQLLPEEVSAPQPGVRVDDLTAGLIGGRFDVVRDDQGSWLQPSREQRDARTELLGNPVPCVGRERELSLLARELDHCIEESRAGAVLVLGTAGRGKSRVRREFIDRLKERDGAAALWFGKADAMSAGSAFGLIARALSDAFGLRDGEPSEARRQKLSSRIEAHRRRGVDVAHMAAFLGEIVGAPFPDEENAQLRAARRSPMLMSDQIRRAWEDFVRAECEARPLVLVLEDLHWGDLPTVNLVGAALRHARDLPFFVLALGRPEVSELFPRIWEELAVQRLHLTPLSRRACERLVTQVLGDRASAELVARLVDRADGNAFYLEELIRAAAEGKVEDLPETVLAMVQVRLEALGEGARRALRAASIFGETFWQNGVAAVLGDANVAPWLDELAQREVIAKRHDGRLVGEVELRFRHALVRDAAYAMLTERDARIGHALAGDWLERTEQADPLALAEHFERGGAPARAARAYLRAAEQALRGNDLEGALAHAGRGLASGTNPATLGALRGVQAEAHLWRGEFSLAEERAAEALARLEHDSAAWFSAATQVVVAMAKQGALDRIEARLEDMVAAAPAAASSALTAKSSFLAGCATELIFGGRYALADRLLEAIERAMSDPAAREAEVVARLEQARAFRISPAGDPEACLAAFEAALSAFEQAGDRRNACMARMNLGFCHAELGDFASAEAVLRSALGAAERMALEDTKTWCLHNLGLVLARGGNVAEGRTAEEEAIHAAERMGDPRLAGIARCYLAQIDLLRGDIDAAERGSRAALELLGAAPPLRVFTQAVRASALLQLGRVVEALDSARAAYSGLQELGTIDEGESLVRLVYAEALGAVGHRAEAAAVIATACDALLARAAKFRDPARRDRFLSAIPHHARTLALARSLAHGA